MRATRTSTLLAASLAVLSAADTLFSNSAGPAANRASADDAAPAGRAAAPLAAVGRPPPSLVEALHLSPVYAKHVDVEGFPVLASARVADAAVREAAYLIRNVIGPRTELLASLARARVRFVVMAVSEMTTDVPEHSDLAPAAYWNRRARGLGATAVRPAVSCGEENLLEIGGDPYAAENILIHEFAHAVHEMALSAVDSTFDRRLEAAFAKARAAGLWRGTYAATNRMEYWAEGTQSWFDCNRSNDDEHNDVDTREKVRAYDAGLARLLTDVFGDRAWRYAKPTKRAPLERMHLAGFDPAKAPRFEWPAPPREGSDATPELRRIALEKAPASSPSGPRAATAIVFVNRRRGLVHLDWLDYRGNRKRYATLQPDESTEQSTFVDHVWVVADDQGVLGAYVAAAARSRAEIR